MLLLLFFFFWGGGVFCFSIGYGVSRGSCFFSEISYGCVQCCCGNVWFIEITATTSYLRQWVKKCHFSIFSLLPRSGFLCTLFDL